MDSTDKTVHLRMAYRHRLTVATTQITILEGTDLFYDWIHTGTGSMGQKVNRAEEEPPHESAYPSSRPTANA